MQPQKSFYVTDWLNKRAKLTPDKLALSDVASGAEITYSQWNANANQTANFLLELGVRRGDRVAVYATNSLAYLDIWMACGKIGAILQNVNWRLTVSEIKQLVADAAPTLLIYSAEFVEQVNGLRPIVSSVQHFVTIDATLAAPSDVAFTGRDACADLLLTTPELHP